MLNPNFWRAHWKHSELMRKDAENEGPKYRALRRALERHVRTKDRCVCDPFNPPRDPPWGYAR